MGERDPRPVGGGVVIESESGLSDVTTREAGAARSLESSGGARGIRDPFIVCLAVLVAASCVMLLVFQSQITFYADEWEFLLDRRGWSVNDFLDPHNDHFHLAPVAIYKLLLATFGMDSPLPFQVTSTLVFVLSAVLLFVYMRRRVDDWLALFGTALILFLGASWIDLLSPFQIAFSGSIAAGLGALLALDRDDAVGDRIACALLAAGISFSEIGVPFVAGALVSVFLVSERRRLGRLYIVFVPLALYGIWWLGWGTEAESAFSLDNVLESPVFVFKAASEAAASLVGLATPLSGNGAAPVGLIWGELLLVAGTGAAIWRLRRLGRVPPTFWVALAIGASFWFLTAFNALPFLREPTSARYQYPGAVFLLLIAAEVLSGVRTCRRAVALGSALTAIAVLSGLWFLHLGQSNILKPSSELLRARLAAVEIARDRLEPNFAVGSFIVPVDASSYLSAADDLGSPAYSESELAASDQDARVAADYTLVQGLGITLRGAEGSPSGALGDAAAGCRLVAATPTGETGVALGPGEVKLKPRPGTTTEVLLARFAEGFPVRLGPLVPGFTSSLTLPPDRASHPWKLGLRGAGRVTVCE